MLSLTQLVAEELAVPMQTGVSEFASHIAVLFLVPRLWGKGAVR
jgi:hypothetical protein